ncbi:MAG: glutathione peroxidase [bacterium]
MPASSLYDLTVDDLAGRPVALADFAGRVTLCVNVASECGYTPQYKGLQRLHESLSSRGFAVLGFPSNEFGGQEPGTPEQIRSFCETKFGVTFPLFEKLVTQPGPAQSPVYRFLTDGREAPDWNFCKYLVDKRGQVIAFYKSAVSPKDPALHAAIEAALAAP